MRVLITLWLSQNNCTLFDGQSEKCPPIPRAGDLIQYDAKPVRVEGVQYIYSGTGVEVQLLA